MPSRPTTCSHRLPEDITEEGEGDHMQMGPSFSCASQSWPPLGYESMDESISPSARDANLKTTPPSIFECPGTMAARLEIFGNVDVPPCAQSTHPQQSITLARRSLRGVDSSRRQERPRIAPDEGFAQWRKNPQKKTSTKVRGQLEYPEQISNLIFQDLDIKCFV